jgi:putative secretion ATPase (PEP-CTERM system associated)
MYTDFYQLTGRPFQLTPDPQFYFDTATHRKAMAYLTYGLSQGEGFIIITGDVGAGKTTLVGHLMETIDRSTLVAAKIVTTQLDADSMLKMVAAAFGIPIDGTDKSGILTRIEQFLRGHHRERRRVLLIVDEAQNLPIAALEELRMLSNFQEGTQALLQMFLLGQPEFRDQLAMSSELEQLRQRVIATHHLEPMTREELPDYIAHRLTICGWNGRPLFTQQAFDAMYDYSGGVPRRLNNLASRVLLFGALEERDEIDETIVNEVIDDLRRDNTPTTGPRPVLDPSSNLSSIGPMSGNIPPKMQTMWNGHDPDVMRRLEQIERTLQSHDQALRQILQLLSEWAADGDASAPPAQAEAVQ